MSEYQPGAPARFDTAGTGGGLHPVREFTSDTGTYTIRYVPRDGVLVWTDRDYGPVACPVSEWLCGWCRTIHPHAEGDRLTRLCPRCGSAMIPTSPSVRALEDARAEITGRPGATPGEAAERDRADAAEAMVALIADRCREDAGKPGACILTEDILAIIGTGEAGRD